jgi:hypothetical protein
MTGKEVETATEESSADAAPQAPEPTYGNEAPMVANVAPQPPPPTGVTYAEEGHAVITAEEFRSQVEREYGRWVAVQDIDINGVPAFRRGDPVPRGHVDGGIVPKDAVVGRDTKTADALYDELNG